MEFNNNNNGNDHSGIIYNNILYAHFSLIRNLFVINRIFIYICISRTYTSCKNM